MHSRKLLPWYGLCLCTTLILSHSWKIPKKLGMISLQRRCKNDLNILLSVKPGLTGLAQILGRGNTDFKIRTQNDIWYVKNWTVYTDLIIIFKTILIVLKREGAS